MPIIVRYQLPAVLIDESKSNDFKTNFGQVINDIFDATLTVNKGKLFGT